MVHHEARILAPSRVVGRVAPHWLVTSPRVARDLSGFEGSGARMLLTRY